jgi:transcriptional regulator with XRE-family HTH domain
MDEIDIYRILGRAVAKRRKDLGLTQAAVAANLGLTRASLANIETGRQKVLLHHVYRMANILRARSIIELIPPALSDGDAVLALPLDKKMVTAAQRMQVESVIRRALAGTKHQKR